MQFAFLEGVGLFTVTIRSSVVSHRKRVLSKPVGDHRSLRLQSIGSEPLNEAAVGFGSRQAPDAFIRIVPPEIQVT